MSLFSVLSVSASGLPAERTRAELRMESLANSETARTPEGGAYKCKDAAFISAPQTSGFSAVSQTELGSAVNGVEVSDVVEDTRVPDQRYIPGHTDAGPDGDVAYLRVNPAEDMLNLMDASRNFQANVAATPAIKDMLLQSINLMK